MDHNFSFKNSMKIISLFLLLGINLSFGQSGAMGYNNYNRSVSSLGLGEQGVASRKGIDGLVYNPANLTHTHGSEFSLYRNPYYYLGFDGFSLHSYSVVSQISENIFIGSEFSSWDYYYPITTAENPDGSGEIEHSFNRTFAFSFAQKMSSEFGYGVQIRYAKDHFGSLSIEHFFGSAGLQYIPEFFHNDLRIGFSLMNFSTPLKYEVTNSRLGQTAVNDAPSSYIRLGFEYDFAKNDFFSTTIHSQVSKEVVKFNNSDGQSSFQSLFNDWNDSPKDMTIHSGISFIFNPIHLGKNFTFIQEIYAGHLNDGPKAGSRTMFYNGFNFGFGVNGLEFIAGYAGLWHIVNNDVYSLFRNELPWETFQFTIRNSLWNATPETEDYFNHSLTKIVLSSGVGYTKRIGRFAEQTINGPYPEYYKIEYSDASSYTIETAFYFSEQSALVTNFRYGRLPVEYKLFVSFFGSSPSSLNINLRIETLTLTSAYRYHPIEMFDPLFFEVGFGVQRQNPIEDTTPKYKYNTVALINTGVLIPINNIVLIPKINFSTLFERINGSAPRLGGYNQFEFSLNIGYLFE